MPFIVDYCFKEFLAEMLPEDALLRTLEDGVDVDEEQDHEFR